MPCLISYAGKTARLDDSEEANEEEIKNARFALNGNDRFYDCKNLIIDVTKCSLEHIQVTKLLVVVATDLGASRIVKSLIVAFLVQSLVNMERVSEYININKKNHSPWEMRLFESEENTT